MTCPNSFILSIVRTESPISRMLDALSLPGLESLSSRPTRGRKVYNGTIAGPGRVKIVTTDIYVHIHMLIHTFVSTYACMYVHMYIRIERYTCTRMC